MIEEVLEKLIDDADSYSITLEDGEFTVYDKEDGDSQKLYGSSDEILVELFTALGAEVEHL